MPDPIAFSSIPNLQLNSGTPKVFKSIAIENPLAELATLERIAGLDKNPALLNEDDVTANRDRFYKLLNELEGIDLYNDDNNPYTQQFGMLFDLMCAYELLKQLKQELGEEGFKNVRVVFVEELRGTDLKNICTSKYKIHHLISQVYTVPKEAQSYYQADNKLKKANLGSDKIPTLKPNCSKTLSDFSACTNYSNIKLEWIIQNPARELRLLKQIANLDGKSGFSQKDLELGKDLLKQLEGYDLYTADRGLDAQLENFNNTKDILEAMQSKQNILTWELNLRKLVLQQTLLPQNERHVIDTGMELNKKSELFIEKTNPYNQ